MTIDLRFWGLSCATLALLAAAPGCNDGNAGGATTTSDSTGAETAADVATETAAETTVETSETAPETEAEAETTPPTPPPPVVGLPLATDTNPDPHIVELTLRAAPLALRVDLDTPALDAYAYNDAVPGPVIEATVGDELIVHFENALPEPTTIHWHGLRIPSDMDGSPRIQTPVAPGETFTYHFTVPDAGTFWYHPHVRANEQVEKGLYGMLIVHERERPAVARERTLVLDDLLLDKDGLAPFLLSGMDAMHGRSGNTLFDNGQTGTLTFAARQGESERWRLVNVANARTMELTLEGAAWRVRGTDGGVLAEPYETTRVTVAVGQRYDLEVIYDQAGEVTLTSHILSLDNNNQVVELAIPIAKATVAASSDPVSFAAWTPAVITPGREPSLDVALQLSVHATATGVAWTINGKSMSETDMGMGGMPGMEPDYLWTAARGTTARITIQNQAGPEHPFHLHGQFFEIVARNGSPITTEPGLKDVVLIPGMETVELRAYLDNPGRWMAHCHILEHAALGMMAEFLVE